MVGSYLDRKTKAAIRRERLATLVLRAVETCRCEETRKRSSCESSRMSFDTLYLRYQVSIASLSWKRSLIECLDSSFSTQFSR